MSRVCIIGMGWLGLQLAKKLKSEGHEVFGTVTSKEKQQRLSNEFKMVIEFNINNYQDNEIVQMENVNYYILTVPPSGADNYGEDMMSLVSKLMNVSPSAIIIYTSSSSVYGSQVRTVSEESETLPESSNGIEIVKIEQFLTENFKERSCILRLCGLVGKSRHPAKYLSGRNDIEKGKAPVNLVHAADVCNLVAYLIEKAINNGTYNVCSPEHPTKKAYYTWAAKQLQLPLPDFDPFDNQEDKIVNCNAIKKINFELNYKSPYDFPLSTQHNEE